MKKRTRTRKDAKEKLNRRLIRQTVKGYARADELMQTEKRAWLKGLTFKESWDLFIDLFQSWEQMRQRNGEGWEIVRQRRLEEKVTLRRLLDRVARKMRDASAESL